VRPVPAATCENVPNRVVFKQLLQAEAIDIMQIDACRVAGVPENLANLLLAAKFVIPVSVPTPAVSDCARSSSTCPFSTTPLCRELSRGGVSSGSSNRFRSVAPAMVVDGRYRAPSAPGASTQMHPESVAEY
jgi:L-fuconate dehydratase